jgi:hypothetical protein
MTEQIFNREWTDPNEFLHSLTIETESNITLAFSCGARSAFNREGKRLLEKHAIAPSAARLCCVARRQETIRIS